MHVQLAQYQQEWEEFLSAQPYALFLQSWTMGEVFREIGQEPVRLEVREDGKIVGVCQAIVVPARRGRHLMIQYGPVVERRLAISNWGLVLGELMKALKEVAKEHRCSFIRMSPFWPEQDPHLETLTSNGAVPSPMHLLSEYTWYIPLKTSDRWEANELITNRQSPIARPEEDILMHMRKTTRNLVRRAEKEGVTVQASSQPLEDLEIYFKLQEETYKRHKFVPYKNSFIRAQVKHFAPQKQAIVYIARYQGEPVAASVHMSYGGITSYHHGASTHKYAKIPASYLLQWTAIREALHRGDDIYNFWGIAPRRLTETGEEVIINSNHPFAGVTTFKTGFGGKPLPLVHCMDVPIRSAYYITRGFEFLRKWRRGF